MTAKRTATRNSLTKLTRTAKAAKTAADRADKTRATALVALITRRKSEIVEAFYDIGEALRELSRKKLYVTLGHKSFAAMLSERKLMSATQANKLIRIVENVPRDTALSLGPERAFALVSLTDATPEKDTVADLLSSKTTSDGTPLRDASSRAIAAEAEKTRKKHKTPTAQDKARARVFRSASAAIREWLATHGIKRPTIATTDDGRLRVELTLGDAEHLAS